MSTPDDCGGRQIKFPVIERNFVGAIRLANWIKRNNWYVSAAAAVNVSEGCVWPGFGNAVMKHCGKRIDLYYIDYLRFISVVLKRGDDGFEILIPSSFNTCHRRFAVCKELCHVLTDDINVRADDPVDQLTSA